MQQRRYGMPAVTLHDRGRGVVARDREHLGLQRLDRRDECVAFLDHPHLALEVAVLAGGVGVLVVHEKIVKVRPAVLEHGDQVGGGLRPVVHRHAGEAREALVHRVGGNPAAAHAATLCHCR